MKTIEEETYGFFLMSLVYEKKLALSLSILENVWG